MVGQSQSQHAEKAKQFAQQVMATLAKLVQPLVGHGGYRLIGVTASVLESFPEQCVLNLQVLDPERQCVHTIQVDDPSDETSTDTVLGGQDTADGEW